MLAPFVWRKLMPLNTQWFSVRISQRNSTMFGINGVKPALDKTVLVAQTPLSLGMLVYRDLTSIVTRKIGPSMFPVH